MTTYYLYKNAAGFPEVLTHLLPPSSGCKLICGSPTVIHTVGMAFNDRDELVPLDQVLPYGDQRRRAYPNIGSQLDALWHAMNRGELPKIDGFYDPIAEVKQRFPKKSN